MIVLRIKGNLKEAQRAAEERNIPVSHISLVRGSSSECCRAEVEEHHRLSVMQWYAEPAKAKAGFGYPIGTLLLHD